MLFLPPVVSQSCAQFCRFVAVVAADSAVAVVVADTAVAVVAADTVVVVAVVVAADTAVAVVVADTAVVVVAADTAVAVVAHCCCLYCVLLALAEKHCLIGGALQQFPRLSFPFNSLVRTVQKLRPIG